MKLKQVASKRKNGTTGTEAKSSKEFFKAESIKIIGSIITTKFTATTISRKNKRTTKRMRRRKIKLFASRKADRG